MASSISNKKTKIFEVNQDYISSLPTDLIAEILKCLPLSTAAKMSVLSKKWRCNWLSHKYLVFDKAFWEKHQSSGNGNENINRERINIIISSILLNHTGPVHEFYLHVPNDRDQVINLNLSQWLSFLSRARVQTITLVNLYKDDGEPIMPSHIFACSELVNLKIVSYLLNTPPSNFTGFANLRTLALWSVQFNHGVFRSLVLSCPRLIKLWLRDCIGISNLAFDHFPTLENLCIQGSFASLAFGNITCLRHIFLSLSPMENTSYIETVRAVLMLATPPIKLLSLVFDGPFCKLLAAGYKKLTQPFNHLRVLRLINLDLGYFNVFCFTIAMVQNCPFIKDLLLAITPKKSVLQHKFDYDDNYKLEHLVKAEITGITGSSPELKLIEYVLGNAVVLEKLLFKCVNLDPTSELKVSRELLQLPRASSKAKLVCLAQ